MLKLFLFRNFFISLPISKYIPYQNKKKDEDPDNMQK